ncbi:MAG: LysE family translocator [Alphaproteobacteria bacterium]|nr:LysE family translocator [Alphaproteobacteria bacterium]
METVLAILGIAITLFIGAATPGASFLMVARTAVAFSRADGLAAALGMGIGGLFFGILAVLGLKALFAQAAWLYLVFKVFGSAYLVYFAVSLWRGADASVAAADTPKSQNWRKSFLFGLLTQISNPKTVLIYTGIFAAFMPQSMPGWGFAVLLPLVFLIEFGWYAFVALAFSASRPRAAYLGARRWIDRAAGAVMGALGGKLIWDAARGA